ncbi:MAG: hypothetical protein ACREJT_05750, partial [Myxococcota bacterium]
MKLAILVAFSCLVSGALAVRADEVQFTNGDHLSGKVLSLADGKLSFDSAIAGKIDIQWADVATFSSDEPVTIVLEDKSVIVDKVALAEPGTVKTLGTSSISAQTVPLASAAKLNPEPEQWKGTAVAGAAFDRGNTHRDSGNAAIDAVRRGEDDRITF